MSTTGTLVFDLSKPETFLFDNLRLGQPDTYGNTKSYPLMYLNSATNSQGISSIDFHPFIFKFPKTRAPFGANTKAHLIDLTLGSKDNYTDNAVYDFLSKFDGCLQDLVDLKLTGVEYEPLVQFSKRKVDGELVDNLEHGPQYTVGLNKRRDQYMFNLAGEKGRLHDIFDIEGTILPGSLVQVACHVHGISVNDQNIARCRPKVQTLKLCEEDSIHIDFTDEPSVFVEM